MPVWAVGLLCMALYGFFYWWDLKLDDRIRGRRILPRKPVRNPPASHGQSVVMPYFFLFGAALFIVSGLWELVGALRR